MKKCSTKLKLIGLTLAGLGAVASGHAIAGQDNTKVGSQGGISIFNATDSAYWFSVGGRLNFDETLFSGNKLDKGNDFVNGGNIRRAFLKLAGGVGEYLTYNLTLDFSGKNGSNRSNGTSVDFEDAWVNACGEYSGSINRANIRLGQFTPPVSIDSWGNYGTMNDTVFLESSLATNAFSMPSKVFGIWTDASALDTYLLSAAVYHPRQNNDSTTSNSAASANNYKNPARSDRLGASVRLTFVPVQTEDAVFHLGAIGRYQAMNNEYAGNSVAQANLFSTTPEARARNTGAVVNTGDIRARSYNVVTAEALGIYGPTSIEAEYYHTNVQRVPTANKTATAGNPRFNGWHVQGGYMLTGETRGYDFATGTLRNPKPMAKSGAWEVVARLSAINLNSNGVYGGKEHNATLGLNWFVNENVRVAANYIKANIRPGSAPAATANVPAKRKLDIFGVRFSVMF